MDKVIVCGKGKAYNNIIDKIKSGYDVLAVADNDRSKDGVIPFSQITQYDYDYVIVTPADFGEIIDTLKKIGVEENKIRRWDSLEKREIVVSSYSQHSEDLIILSIFKQIGIERPTWIDLGANSPFTNSNTAMFYKMGGRGINVEPNPLLFSEFERYRPEDTNINCGVATSEGTLPFYSFGSGYGINTFSKEEAEEREKRTGLKIKEVMQLPVVTLKHIVDEYVASEFPDLLDCDIEGLDYDVLSDYDFAKAGPKVMIVEAGADENEKFDQMITAKGYYKFCRMNCNNIYVRNDYKGII